MIKNPKLTLRLILSAIVLISVVGISCNGGETSEPAKDTTATKMEVATPPAPDTTKMDTASTRPVQTPN